ncbi:MAG: hypothetical protein KTR31_14260, partial [Myxococcales bacterium]|nr:hypothetical protein [Myxococcales bacterium]
DGDSRIAMTETLTVDAGSTVADPDIRFRYQLGNHLGSAAVELDDNAALVTYEEFHPYGTTSWWAEKSGIEVSAKRYRYTGMERDDETGLALHGVRLYAAWLGRWVRCDPIGMDGGPNRFEYARSSPTVARDRSGKAPSAEDFVGPRPEDAQTGPQMYAAEPGSLRQPQGGAGWQMPNWLSMNIRQLTGGMPPTEYSRRWPNDWIGGSINHLLHAVRTAGEGAYFNLTNDGPVRYDVSEEAALLAGTAITLMTPAGKAGALETQTAAHADELLAVGGRKTRTLAGAAGRRVTWAPNRWGADRRTADEAIDLIEEFFDSRLPSNVRFEFVADDAMEAAMPGADAFYGPAGQREAGAALVTPARVMEDGVWVIRMREGLLATDEGILSTAAHELTETVGLDAAFKANQGGMSADLFQQTVDRLHQRALDVESRFREAFRRGAFDARMNP